MTSGSVLSLSGMTVWQTARSVSHSRITDAVSCRDVRLSSSRGSENSPGVCTRMRAGTCVCMCVCVCVCVCIKMGICASFTPPFNKPTTWLVYKYMRADLLNVAVCNACNGALHKPHLVARECPRLVTEDILHLPKLLVQRRRARTRRRVRLLVVHLNIVVDKHKRLRQPG